jgi:hypothetical protein
MDYLRYWALRRKPFLFQLDEDFFAGVPQREALAGISYFIGSDQNLSMLLCPAQNGLSWLLSHVQQMRGFGDQATEFVVTSCSLPGRQQILSALFQALGFMSAAKDLDRQIDDAIGALRQQDVRLVWLLDRCHASTATIAKDLADRHPNLSILVCCTRPVARRAMLQLGKCPMQIDLSTLSVDDTCEYFQFCMHRAGGDLKAISDNTAVRLHEVTGGVIGRMAIAAESSLALAASHRLDRVTPAVVEAIAEHQRRAA